MMKELRSKNNIIILIGICIIHTLILYKLCSFSRAMETYRDELFYYDISTSIFFENSLEIQGLPYHFQNLAYSYFLLPFFLISNSVLRIKTIAFINSLILSLVLIPVWFICKELGLTQKESWLAVLIVSVSPDMLNAGSFMSENLYWPLVALTLLFTIKSFKSSKIITTGFAAIFAYLVYWCKEVGICFALAYVASIFLNPVFEYIVFRGAGNKKIEIKSQIIKLLTNLTVYLCSFVACHLIFSLFVYSKEPNPYVESLGFSFLHNLESFSFFLYSVFYYFIALAIVYLVFPIFIPIFALKEDDSLRNAFLYTVTLVIGMVLVIVITITLSEDYGNYAPRLHLRYLGPIACTVFPIFFRSLNLLYKDRKEILSRQNSIFLLLVASFILFVYKGTYFGPVTENLTLSYNALAEKVFAGYDTEKFSVLNVMHYPGAPAVSLFVLAFVIAGIIILQNKKSVKVFRLYFVVFILATSIFNLAVGESRLRIGYGANTDMVMEMSSINDYFHENDKLDSNILFVTDYWAYKSAKVFDTYFDGTNSYQVTADFVKNILYSDFATYNLDRDGLVISDVFTQTSFKDIDSVDYFIINNAVFNELTDLNGVTVIPEISGCYYTVLENIDSHTIEHILPDENELIKYVFTSNGNNISDTGIEGISVCEGGYTWTKESLVHIPCRVDSDIERINVDVYFENTFNGKQNVIILQNNEEIYSSVAEGVGRITFVLTSVDGSFDFEIYLPDSESPYNLGQSEDQRKLALALTRIVISDSKG